MPAEYIELMVATIFSVVIASCLAIEVIGFVVIGGFLMGGWDRRRK